jgi:glycosyltransferase involved in cell wall biosynthesis
MHLAEFEEILRLVRPDAVHFHGLGRFQSPDHMMAAKRVGCRVVMTYHAPGQSCLRWDLLRDGREMCDGRIEVERCSRCTLERLGLPGPVAAIFASRDLSSMGSMLPDRFRHPFLRRAGTESFLRRWRQALDLLDGITWHARWVRDLLLRNGAAEAKLHLLRLPPPEVEPATEDCPDRDACKEPLRLLFAGRLSDIKGVHVLTSAVRLISSAVPLKVEIIGAKGPNAYYERIRREIARDPRIDLQPPVGSAQAMAAMARADAVIVPSLWPETGPYTVIEAMWVGTPVVGSDRAGIREIMDEWGGGVLFKPGSAEQLATILTGTDLRGLRGDGRAFRSAWKMGFDRELGVLRQSLSSKGMEADRAYSSSPARSC